MKRRLVLVAALSGLLLYGSATAASAATHHRAASSQHQRPAAGAAQNCVAQALPAGSMVTPTATCYATFSAAIKAATGGRVTLPATAKPGSVTPAMIDAWNAAPATTFVLSIDYKDANFGGGSLTWTQSSDCGKFQAASMPSGWNDVVSSLVTGTNCANSLYQNVRFGGTRLDVSKNTSRSGLGSFNDLTSSQKWCTAKPCT
jgi:Peptidase inhibitor family I36